MPDASQRGNSAALSPWRPLRVALFRNLLIADLVSDIGTFMQTMGAAWLMTTLTTSTVYIALIQTASALPFFLLALPAGSLGDIFDRRKLILCTETWMFVMAGILGVVTFSGHMTPWLLLALTLALSLGDAVESPAWRAIFPELVTKEDLTPALALNGIEFNLARAVGPGLAGLVIAAVGVATAFVVDAISFLGVIFVIFTWKRPVQKSTLPAETITEASWAAIRYVRYSPAIRTLLVRSGIVIFFSSSFWALLPAVAKQLSNSPYGYGFMLGAFGIGAVLGAVVLQRARGKFSTEAVLSAATVVFGAVLLSTALLHNLQILCGLMLFGGAAWTVFMSLFNTIIQKLAPDWIRARVLASYLFVFQGSVALGSTLWGFAAQRTSLRWALLASGAGIGLSLLLQFPLRLPSTPVDLSPWNHWDEPHMFHEPSAENAAEVGPVLVSVRYVIDPAKTADFLNEIYKYERVRRRDGATRWGIYYDSESPHTYLEIFLVNTLAEHERQHDHFTVADHELEKRVQSYTVEQSKVKHFIYAKKTKRS
jgi:MFS family permease|nr:MFS transporter [Candidatus Acidoferrales bacterium]